MSTAPAHFTHLHVHSHFSLLQATPTIPQLIERAAAGNLIALALTDASALLGAVAFARACRDAGIRPITGMTVALPPPPGDFPADNLQAPGRLVLLARNNDGYRSLCRLSSLLQTDPRRARRSDAALTWPELGDHTQGLICITGGRAGWLERYVRSGQTTTASRLVARLGGLFGDQLVIGISADLRQPALRPVADQMLDMAGRFGLRAAAVQPVYCLSPDHRERLRLLAAIDHNRLLADVSPGELPDLGDPDTTLHWLSPEEMAGRFAGQPQLLDTAAEIACEILDAGDSILPDGRTLWPATVKLEGQRPEAVLEERAANGLERQYPAPVPELVTQRLQRELAAIVDYGYAAHFLLVADIVSFARRSRIPVSTRGSVANSLVAYCLGITTVDPIEHDLLFERFLNPARRSPPDIDLDFCSRRRDEVLEYIRRTYGADRVALVATFNTFRTRSAVRETAKAHGLAAEEIRELSSLAHDSWHPDPRRRTAQGIAEALAGIQDARQREVFGQAMELVGLVQHLGLHPGGLIITPGPLTDTTPIMVSPKGFLATQYEHPDVEAIGLPKLDLLGIRALTVLADAAELVRRFQDSSFLVEDIPATDEPTAAILTTGSTIGVFQCESEGARRTLRQLKAATVRDLAVAGAFFKPGPATGGMAQSFIRRYRSEEQVSYLHPALEPILKQTKGVLLFQEQVLRVATEIAGLTWDQADRLRKGMSKFRADEMEALAADFEAGCCRAAPAGPGLSEKQAATLWRQVVAFAGYGFNQGHATAYADVSYRSAYIKAHWPAEFLCARLADAGGYHHPAVYLAEARRLGIDIRPPHANHSGRHFTLAYEPERDGPATRPVLWMGLGQIADLRRATVRAIVRERANRPFSGWRDLMARVPIQTKEAEHLIRCGALDGLDLSRAAMLAGLRTFGDSAGSGQLAFGFAAPEDVAAETVAERLQWEERILGLPISVHPVCLVEASQPPTRLRDLQQRADRATTVLAARIPGWPGSGGFFISDEDDFVVARLERRLQDRTSRPALWRPLRFSGRWLTDEWGMGWFQVGDIAPA